MTKIASKIDNGQKNFESEIKYSGLNRKLKFSLKFLVLKVESYLHKGGIFTSFSSLLIFSEKYEVSALSLEGNGRTSKLR